MFLLKDTTQWRRYFILYKYDELTCCVEYSVDPDQMASSEAIWSGSTLFSVEFISGLILFLIEFIHFLLFKHIKCYVKVCSWGQVNLSLDKYLMPIYLSLGK